jgi:Hemolysins and related proteins containing CBS domains
MNPVWIVILLFLLIAIFTGLQVAIILSHKLRFELEIKQRGLVSKLLLIYLKNPAYSILINKTGYLLTLGAVVFTISAAVLRSTSDDAPVQYFEILGITLVLVIVADILAQTLFRILPNRMLRTFAVPAFFLFLPILPLAWLIISLDYISNLLFRMEKKPANIQAFTESANYNWIGNTSVKESRNEQNNQEVKIFQKALVFSKVRIRDCMIPRTEIEAININAEIDELRKRFISSGYSKVLVYKSSMDNVVGYVSCKEMFKHPLSIKEKLSQLTFVPETMQANRLLHDFMQYHRSIAVVVDEYGGTSGLVTLEDIMEEIFGEIKDEHDTDDLIEKQLSSREFIFSGRLEIEYLNSKYQLGIPENEDYGTLAGYILYYYQNLPKHNTIITIENYQFKILRVSQTRIDLVHLDLIEK